jgi:hypothetical protein
MKLILIFILMLCNNIFTVNTNISADTLSQKQAIPLNRADAVSFPYGVTDDLFKPTRVLCPDKKPAKNNDINNCNGITQRQILLHNLITDFYSNAPVCGMKKNGKLKLYSSIQEPNPYLEDKESVAGYEVTPKDPATTSMLTMSINSNKLQSYDACTYTDMTKFNGLICAGDVLIYGLQPEESLGCQAVKDAQDSNGRIWRSPFRMATNNLGKINTFSADMDLGVLLYALAANDKTNLSRWWEWISSNTPCLTKNLTGGCLIRELPRYCNDNNCMLRPLDIKMIREAAPYFNLALPSQLNSYDAKLYPTLLFPLTLPVGGALLTAMSNDTYWWIDMDSKLSDPGFALHLDGARILFLRFISKDINTGLKNKNMDSLDNSAKELFRRQPLNPFFSYLADGGPIKPASEKTVYLFNQQCLGTQHIADQYNHSEWAWQRADKDIAWEKSSLWDCRFLAQALYSNSFSQAWWQSRQNQTKTYQVECTTQGTTWDGKRKNCNKAVCTTAPKYYGFSNAKSYVNSSSGGNCSVQSKNPLLNIPSYLVGNTELYEQVCYTASATSPGGIVNAGARGWAKCNIDVTLVPTNN